MLSSGTTLPTRVSPSSITVGGAWTPTSRRLELVRLARCTAQGRAASAAGDPSSGAITVAVIWAPPGFGLLQVSQHVARADYAYDRPSLVGDEQVMDL